MGFSCVLPLCWGRRGKRTHRRAAFRADAATLHDGGTVLPAGFLGVADPVRSGGRGSRSPPVHCLRRSSGRCCSGTIGRPWIEHLRIPAADCGIRSPVPSRTASGYAAPCPSRSPSLSVQSAPETVSAALDRPGGVRVCRHDELDAPLGQHVTHLAHAVENLLLERLESGRAFRIGKLQASNNNSSPRKAIANPSASFTSNRNFGLFRKRLPALLGIGRLPQNIGP